MVRPQTSLEVDTVTPGPPVVLRVGGVLDISTVEALMAAAGHHLAEGIDVIVDIADVRLCDSTGLGALVGLKRLAVTHQCDFAIRGARGYVARVISMSGIDRVIRTEGDPSASGPKT